MDQIMKTSAELDAIVPEEWSALWYPTLLENLVWMPSISSEYEGEISALGDTVNITSFPQFPDAVDLAEGAKNDAQAITMTKTQLVVNHEIAQDFIITRKGLKQSLDAQDKLRELAMFSVMKKIDQLIFNDVVPSASNPDHQISYSSGVTLALADILDCKELLDLQNVPDNGQRAAILGVSQYNDLFNIAGFVSRDFSPNADALTQGAITTPVLGFSIRFTTLVANVCTFFDPIFMQLAVQEKPVPEVFNLGVEGVRAFRTNLTALFGNKQLDSKRVVQIA